METLDITMLIGLVLMVSALVILYRCARGKSRRQRMNELADTLLSIHDSFELQVRRLETLSGEIASDNEKCSSLQYRAGQLQDTVDSLEYRRDELDRENLSLARTHDELMRSNTDLTEKAARLRNAIVQDGQAVVELEQRIDTLRRIKEGLEIAVENKPAEEVPYLSQPLFSLGVQPSAQNHLTAYGLRYVGDLVRRDEQYLMEIWGIGPATVERIKTKLNENGACLDMDVIRVDNRWYRRKTD